MLLAAVPQLFARRADRRDADARADARPHLSDERLGDAEAARGDDGARPSSCDGGAAGDRPVGPLDPRTRAGAGDADRGLRFGEQGRFGNQLRSIPMLLDRPLGFGPFRFAKYFPADPHEVFLSAFASFGWVGGIAFAVFVALTLYVGFVFVFRRSRAQTEFIGVFAAHAAATAAGRADRHHALAPSVHADRLPVRPGGGGAPRSAVDGGATGPARRRAR